MLIKYPQLWNRHEFREIRSKVNAIVTDPDTFPLSPRGWGALRDCLTKGVANQLKNRSMTAQLEHRTDESAIYLQISKASRDTKNDTIRPRISLVRCGNLMRLTATTIPSYLVLTVLLMVELNHLLLYDLFDTNVKRFCARRRLAI
jgi:hypothetical protein